MGPVSIRCHGKMDFSGERIIISVLNDVSTVLVHKMKLIVAK